MFKTTLTNIAYAYYPKGIDSIKQRDEYNNSDEFKRFEMVVNSYYSTKENIHTLNLLKKEFSRHDSIKNFNDISSLSFDRCLTIEFEFLETDSGKLYRIVVMVSILIPYFFIYVLENEIQLEPYKWLSSPRRDKETESNKFKNEINLISDIIKQISNFDLFPEKYLDIVLEDVSFSDIRMGYFSFFNAFFKGENLNDYD